MDFLFWGLWDLVEDNSEEKPFVAILSRSIHIMPGLFQLFSIPEFGISIHCSQKNKFPSGNLLILQTVLLFPKFIVIPVHVS